MFLDDHFALRPTCCRVKGQNFQEKTYSPLYPQSIRYCSLRSSPLYLAPATSMQVSKTATDEKAAQDPQDFWFLAGVTQSVEK